MTESKDSFEKLQKQIAGEHLAFIHACDLVKEYRAENKSLRRLLYTMMAVYCVLIVSLGGFWWMMKP